jgi:hypothetical protein
LGRKNDAMALVAFQTSGTIMAWCLMCGGSDDPIMLQVTAANIAEVAGLITGLSFL